MEHNFNILIDNNLDGCINAVRFRRFDNDVRKLEFLLDRLNLSLHTVATYVQKSHGQIHHYKRGKNKLPALIAESVDSLLKFSLSTLEQKMSRRPDLSDTDKKAIDKIISDGKELVGTRRTIVRQQFFMEAR